MEKQENPNAKYLVPQNMRTKEEQSRIARMGGIKSGEVRKQKKLLRELLEMELENLDKSSGLSNEVCITKSLVEEAKNKNIKAYEIIRDTLGQKPTDNVNVTGALPVVVSGEDELK